MGTNKHETDHLLTQATDRVVFFHMDDLPSAHVYLQLEPKAVKTWAQEVDEAEEKGLDVFAPQTNCLPYSVILHCETGASEENQAAAAAAIEIKMSATQKGRARRRALAEALKPSAESEAAAKPEETRVSAENKATAAVATEIKLSTSQMQRTRRKALAEALKASAEGEAAAKLEETRAAAENEASAARMKSVARLPCAEKTSRADCTEETRTPDRTPIWPSPSARASGSDGDPLVTKATAAPATRGGTSATRRRRARRKALAARTKAWVWRVVEIREPSALERSVTGRPVALTGHASLSCNLKIEPTQQHDARLALALRAGVWDPRASLRNHVGGGCVRRLSRPPALLRPVAPPTMGEAEGCGTVTSVPEDVADALAELKKLLYPDTE
ncbi:hypothetical protein O3P69_019097 [Scylla paramamosain]|uniref:Uncharacterized protein n=1 Tax=Scylla paramamosain TaxID=85552 RepID=A0AAW0S9I6_SCYPA